MNIRRIIGFLVLISGVLVQAKDTLEYYKPEQIQIINFSSTDLGDLIFDFEYPQETLYFCPGLSIKEENNQIIIKFIRSQLSSRPKVDGIVSSKKDKPYISSSKVDRKYDPLNKTILLGDKIIFKK